MVILAVTICTRPGKLVCSRQFVEMTRIRIEGLISAFPKLLEGAGGKQHTFVETENVRYLYHPLEGLYLVLITSKTSNIVQDLETMKLVSKLVTEYCPVIEEEAIRQNPFDFVFAVDEVISLGYREQMSLSQVKTSMEMQSHDHRLAQLMRKEQEEEAKRKMKERQEEIQRKNRESGGMKTGGGFGGGGPPGGGGDSFLDSVGGGGGGEQGGNLNSSGGFGPSTIKAPPTTESSGPKIGATRNKISLKDKKSKNSLLDQMAMEGEVVSDPMADLGMAQPTGPAGGPASAMMQEPIHFNVEEICKLTFDSDGTLEQMLVNGNIFLLITDQSQAAIKIRVMNNAGPEFQFKTHPRLHKEGFFGSKPEAWLQLAKEGDFPCGNPLGVLKWRYACNDEDKAPIKVTCWPSEQRGKTHVNMEYELGDTITELTDLVIAIPLPGSATRGPEIIDCSGETSFDSKNMQLLWRISTVDDSNSSGALEFALPEAPHEAFFPINVQFVAPQTYCNIEVLDAFRSADMHPVKFSKNTNLKVEEYTIGA